MLEIHFYGDESGDASDPNVKVVSIAGFAATPAEWGRFDDEWRNMLDTHKIDHLHMRQLAHCIGPFARFKNDEAARISLFQDVVAVIRQCRLRGFGSMLVLSELARYCEERSLSLDPYGLCLYHMYIQFCQRYPEASQHTKLRMFLDRAHRGHQRVESFKEFVDGDPELQQRFARGQPAPEATALSHSSAGSQHTPALQAADFLAWELRYGLTAKLEWYLTIKPNLTDQSQEALDAALGKFMAQRRPEIDATPENAWRIRERGSLANLLELGITTSAPIDYTVLRNFGDFRKRGRGGR